MTREILTAERALQLLREVVAERPGYVYEAPDSRGCAYVDPATGEPSCLVGHVFIRAGWSAAELRRWNRTAVSWLPSNLAISEGARCMLDEAQQVQDSGWTWGEALLTAEGFAAGPGEAP